MKATLFLAAAGLVAAQDFGGQPKCALECLQENIPKAGCDFDDTACQCEPDFQKKLLPIITPCLTQDSGCSTADLIKAQEAAKEACEAYAKTAGSGSGTTATATASDEEETGSVTVSVDTSITGSVSVPAIFSSVTEQPNTPVPNNKTTAKPTKTSGGDGSGSEESGTATGDESGAATATGNAAAVAGPAFGLLAVFAAALAL
ncbi:cell wall [Fusarium albosuccineum]|uniref:Cell wall n=1 Tax=Fusarium albosuccineum TaxID=1237068 RepID=A0A8H4KZT3_9HYPO|nr:cell wall [Fusarium albosuccineum]